MTLIGADLIAKGLVAYGVEHVFAIVSIHNMPIFDAINRLGKTLLLIKKELDLSRLQADISKRIEDRISENQREFFLKEQLKEIRKELGLSKDEKTQELENQNKDLEQ